MTEPGPPRESVPGPHPPTPFGQALKRRIAVTISLKLALLIVLYLLFFSPSQRPRIDDAAIDRHLLPTR